MADSMEFSKDIDGFINDYSFKDTDEVYTNGSELIQVFRVQQALEHYFPKETKMIDKSNFSKEQYKMDLQSAHDCGYQKGIQEAKEYKDLAEQGRLIELPCKIGDKIFVIPSRVNYKLNVLNEYDENNRVYEQDVEKIIFCNDGRYLLITCDGLQSVVSDFYKINWFLTKTEADQALVERKE